MADKPLHAQAWPRSAGRQNTLRRENNALFAESSVQVSPLARELKLARFGLAFRRPGHDHPAMNADPLFFPRGDKDELELGDKLRPKFDADGLIPCITVDGATNEVVMFAFMNELALRRTIETGRATYWSRSRGKLWLKGEESGNFQTVREIRTDCDQDVILIKVDLGSTGAACHTGYTSCFYRRLGPDGRLEMAGGERRFDPALVYRKKS